MIRRSKREIDRAIGGLESSTGEAEGKRPTPLTIGEKRALDEYFSPPYDGDNELRGLGE